MLASLILHVMFVFNILSGSGGEETAKRRREAQAGLYQERLPTGGVEMEERVSFCVSLHIFS